MLAGKMKLKNFLALVGCLGVLGGGFVVATGGAAFVLGGEDDDGATHPVPDKEELMQVEKPELPVKPVNQPPSEPVAAEPETASNDAPSPAGRPVDQAVMDWAGKDLGSSKKKDVTKGQPYKVNVYQDDGHSSMNRAKIDLDRDDQWDEKWTFDGTHISRKVAPNDDENYSEMSVWSGTEWVAESTA